jgi:hypothetical protein
MAEPLVTSCPNRLSPPSGRHVSGRFAFWKPQRRLIRDQAKFNQWLLPGNGLRVSDRAQFVLANGIRDGAPFDDVPRFRTRVIPYDGSDAWVEPALRDVADCLASGSAPEAAPPRVRLLRVRGAGVGNRLTAHRPKEPAADARGPDAHCRVATDHGALAWTFAPKKYKAPRQIRWASSKKRRSAWRLKASTCTVGEVAWLIVSGSTASR